jgi:hypothetical protein
MAMLEKALTFWMAFSLQPCPEPIFGHAKSKFQRPFRSPIRSCLNSTRIPKTSALRAAEWPILRAPNIIIYNSHHTHTHCIYILMEIKFSIKLPGSACPAAATAAGLLPMLYKTLTSETILLLAVVCVCMRVVSCSTYNLFKIFIPSEQTGHNGGALRKRRAHNT